VFVARNVKFLEEEYLLQEASGSREILYKNQEPQTNVPSTSSIILHDPKLVVEEVAPTEFDGKVG
jgi:hypothetical protein